MKYVIITTISTPRMLELADTLNEWMSGFGFKEKICITSDIRFETLTSKKELTGESIDKFIGIVRDSFNDSSMKIKLFAVQIKKEDMENGRKETSGKESGIIKAVAGEVATPACYE